MMRDRPLMMLTIMICVILLPSACVAQSQLENVGILGRINSRGLELLNDVMIEVISSQVTKVKISEVISGKAIGIWNYELANFQIEAFRVSTSSLSTSPPNVIRAEIRRSSVSLIGQFKISRKKLFTKRTKTTKGSFRGTASKVDLTVEIAIDKDTDRKPKFTLTSCRANIGKLSLQTYGSSIARSIAAVFNAASIFVRNALEGLICPQLNLSVNERLKKILDKFSPIVPLPLDTSIDLGLVRPPVMDSNSAEMAFSGRCFPTNSPSLHFNISKSHVTSLEDSTRMFQVAVSEYVINTFLASVIRHQLFRQSITEAELSGVINFDLSARVLSYVIPSLVPYIGKPLRFAARPSRVPMVNLMEDSIGVFLGYEMYIQAALGNDSYFDALIINLGINVIGSIEVNDNVISGRFDSVNVTVIESEGLPSAFLETIINGLVDREVVPRLNNLAITGLAIPSFYSFQLGDTRLKLKENSLEIDSDLART